MRVAELEHPPPGTGVDRLADCGPTIAWALRFFHELRDGVPLCVETSGTTGAPKRVCHDLDTVAANAEAVWAALDLREEGERWLCPLPVNHIGGRMVLARCWYMNGTPVLGGAGASRDLLERARDAGWHVRQSYGLTEACSTVTIADAEDVETSGRPLRHLWITLAQDGEILVHGIDREQLATGDRGRLTGDGRLIVTGRTDDMLVTGGENVMPEEVEAVLRAFPGVADAAVVGRTDPEWGSRLTALVVPGREPLDVDRLRDHCRDRLPGFKVPKEFELVEGLPRSPSGKLLRRELR